MITKYNLLVYGNPRNENETTTAIFKSSYCKTNTIIFDSKDEAIQVKNYLNTRGIKSHLIKEI
jgi:hypothetical protein